MKAMFAIVFLALVAVSMAQFAYNYAGYPAAISTYGAGYYGLGAYARPAVYSAGYGAYGAYGAYPYFRR